MLAAVALGTVRLAAPPPVPSVAVDAPATMLAAPGTPPPVRLPPQGAIALDSEEDGRLASQDADSARPIASVAKTMTALAVLRAHPLAVGQEGPVLTMTQADVDLYRSDLAADGSTLPVAAGERLTERQVLLGLMLPSANNLADTLALWMDGTAPAFTARLNALAATLGMTRSHFADASGFNPLTVSSPTDLLRLGRAVLATPALAAIVATRAATLPDGTELRTLDTPLLTEPGWLGIKTGSTPQAGGCLLFAVRRPVGEAVAPVTLVGAVLGQTDRFAAQQAAREAVDSAFSGYVPVDVGRLPLPVGGIVTTRWGANSTLAAPPAAPEQLELRQGSPVGLAVATTGLTAPVAAGERAGTVTLSVRGRAVLRRALTVSRAIPGPGIGWRLVNG